MIIGKGGSAVIIRDIINRYEEDIYKNSIIQPTRTIIKGLPITVLRYISPQNIIKGPNTWKKIYSPTYSVNMPEIIDFIIVRNISVNYCEIDKSLGLISPNNRDHSPIIVSESVIKKCNFINVVVL